VGEDQDGGHGSLVDRVAEVVLHRVLETVPPDRILDEVDVQALIDRVDVDALLARVAVDDLLDRVDVDRLLDRVDPDRLLDRVDPDRLLDRVDVDRLVARVDVDALLRGVDIEALVRRSGVPDLVAESVAESTNRFAGSAIDAARRQVAGVDVLAAQLVGRVLRRRTPAEDEDATAPARMSVTGRPANLVSRALAAAADAGAIFALWSAGYAGLQVLLQAFLGISLSDNQSTLGALSALALWSFTYVVVSTTITGRTPGKAVVGLRITRADTGVPTFGRLVMRTLLLPVEVLTLGAGLLPVLLRRDHRALHDLLAGTAVVYDWGDRQAELPGPLTEFLARSTQR